MAVLNGGELLRVKNTIGVAIFESVFTRGEPLCKKFSLGSIFLKEFLVLRLMVWVLSHYLVKILSIQGFHGYLNSRMNQQDFSKSVQALCKDPSGELYL